MRKLAVLWLLFGAAPVTPNLFRKQIPSDWRCPTWGSRAARCVAVSKLELGCVNIGAPGPEIQHKIVGISQQMLSESLQATCGNFDITLDLFWPLVGHFLSISYPFFGAGAAASLGFVHHLFLIWSGARVCRMLIGALAIRCEIVADSCTPCMHVPLHFRSSAARPSTRGTPRWSVPKKAFGLGWVGLGWVGLGWVSDWLVPERGSHHGRLRRHYARLRRHYISTCALASTNQGNGNMFATLSATWKEDAFRLCNVLSM